MIRKSASKQVLAAVVLMTWVLAPIAHAQSESVLADSIAPPFTEQSIRESFVRTELYFGTEREHLSPVTDDDWRSFLDLVVTRKFPEGLTVLTAYGQFQDDAGNVNREKSFVLILLYPSREWKKRSESIEFIRKAYKDAFQQRSVLRVDFRPPVKVSF